MRSQRRLTESSLYALEAAATPEGIARPPKGGPIWQRAAALGDEDERRIQHRVVVKLASRGLIEAAERGPSGHWIRARITEAGSKALAEVRT